ncbi:hypothetical protein K7472_20945 [Streptomyces sp. PTM05]|uniref:DUF4935 domain-containing protein n=1 Tax=Streptantibioticus parmotrematis TaxID=2873249 RepID=A0ABS7QVP3_9ACTN|nr:PIN domain-containing protein [Streptantibioticus parmotrematis]MBY8887288.1 hypothetical protein [Streptantibioticus parmotrematis]
MIVLDTNQLEHVQPPHGPGLAMLRTIARETGHELALPEMAFEEHLAHIHHRVQKAESKITGGINELQRLAPFWPGNVSPLPGDHVLRNHRDELMKIFRVLQTPDGVAREALLRETQRRLPAAGSWELPGTGGRDVAIWLTALDECRQSGMKMYFVSMDKNAFGGPTLHPELREDITKALAGRAELFHYCNGVTALLEELAEKRQNRLTKNRVAKSLPVRDALTALGTGHEFRMELIDAAGLANVTVASGPELDHLELTKLEHETSYQLGDSAWATARATWQAAKHITASWFGTHGQDISITHEVQVVFTVTTTLLMQLDATGAITAAEIAARTRCTNITSNIVR